MFGGGFVGKMYPYEGDYSALLYSGIAIMILGFIIRWTAIVQLGKAFTVDVSISKTHKIKDDGLYKNCAPSELYRFNHDLFRSFSFNGKLVFHFSS